MNASERWRLINNIIARTGIDGDVIGELARAEAMINAIDQGKMMPPPLPPEITEPTEPMNEPMPYQAGSMAGKYDNL